MDIIEGNTRLIIIDPLVSKETAQAALQLYYQNRPNQREPAIHFFCVQKMASLSHSKHVFQASTIVDYEYFS